MNRVWWGIIILFFIALAVIAIINPDVGLTN